MLPRVKKEKIDPNKLNKFGSEFYIVYINLKILSYINQEFGDTPEHAKIQKYRNLAEEKLIKDKEKSEKNRSGKITSIPISKTTGKIAKGAVAGTAALYLGGHATGTATKVIAPAASSLVKLSLKNAFGIFSNASVPLNYVASAANNLIGNAAGKLVAGIVPIPLLYISILEMSKLFYFGLGKAQSFLKTAFMPKAEDLSFLPNEGPVLALICNFSTLTVLNELITTLKVSNLKSIKFNFLALVDSVKNLNSNHKLNKEDRLLRNIVATNINEIKKIASNAHKDPGLLEQYKKLKPTQQLISLIKPYTNNGIDKKILFWLSVFGKLTTTYQDHLRNFLLNTVETILIDETYTKFHDPGAAKDYDDIIDIESILTAVESPEEPIYAEIDDIYASIKSEDHRPRNPDHTRRPLPRAYICSISETQPNQAHQENSRLHASRGEASRLSLSPTTINDNNYYDIQHDVIHTPIRQRQYREREKTKEVSQNPVNNTRYRL